MTTDRQLDAQISAEKNNGGVCCRCHRRLKNPKAVAAGIGPTCAKKEAAQKVAS